MTNLKLNKILKALSKDETKIDFKAFDDQVNQLKSNLKEKIVVKTLEDVALQLDKFKKKLDLQPLLDAVSSLESSFKKETQDLYDEIEAKTLELSRADNARVENLNIEISDLQIELSTLEEVRKKDLENLRNSIPSLTDIEDRLSGLTIELSARLDVLEEPLAIKDWQEEIDKLRRDLMSRLSNLGGGSMNRQIFIGGVNPLTRFTDINLKAGAGVTLTYANNNSTQKVDVTITSTGGGGGTVRSINSVSSPTTAGSTAGTDYVYLVSGTTTITLPTAVGNTNLYTIKNVGTGVVTINTTGGELIDNDTTIVMPVRYTSVDLISDTVNWNVT